jgi:DeoR/GlpR family transcriptional regulator of sugar metabolism
LSLASQKDLFAEERRRAILESAIQEGRVSVSELGQRFGVSEATIRIDLQALEDRNLLIRTHGGAVPVISRMHVLSLALRRQQKVIEKKHIGAAAAGLVANGDAICLDSSSTTLAMTPHLRNHRDLTIVTNSLAVAQEMLDVPTVTVVMLGGTLRRETTSLVGIEGLEALRRFNVRKGFFGAHGIAITEGLTDVSVAEAEVKKHLVAMCHQVIAVLDATKWGQVGLASFAELTSVHSVVTNQDAPAQLVEQIRSFGIQVILA